MTVAVLSLGTEIIRGELVNTNAQWLAEAISDEGHEVSEILCIGDDRAAIADALRRLARVNDTILCTGGLGPTSDDVTTEAAAEVVGAELVLDLASLERIRERFKRAGRQMASSNEKQALFPKGSEVLDNLEGTAPGFALTLAGARAFFLPGVPHEMRGMFERHVRPVLAQTGPGYLHQARLNTFGLPESAVNDQLAGIESEFGVQLGYRAHFPEIQVKVLAHGADQRAATARAELALAEVRRRLGEEVVFGSGKTTLAQAVGEELRARGMMLGLAESCTGGLVAQLLTENAGASDYFMGGVVCYSNRIKEQLLGVPARLLEEHGAVSGEVAEAMARGACRSLDVPLALAITGIAGPAGGNADKPVGLVHLAVCHGSTLVHERSIFPGDRRRVQFYAAFKGLGMLRRVLGGLGRG